MHYRVPGGPRRLREPEEFTSLFSPGEVEYANTNRLRLTAGGGPAALVYMLRPPLGG